MPLNLDKVFPQVGGMVDRLQAERALRQQRLDTARELFGAQGDNLDALARKIDLSQTTWLVAGLVNGLDPVYSAPSVPADFAVLATDGSHIDVDRHRSPRCYLINIGAVALRYGAAPDAVLDSFPALYSGEEKLVISPEGVRGREVPVEGTLLGLKRGVDECCRLARLAAEVPANLPALALVDGTLVLWGFEGQFDFVTEALLERGFLSYLEEVAALNRGGGRIALVSYISLPRATEVVNVLRLALCPREILDTDCCPSCETRECEAVEEVRDRDLFAGILAPGERSTIFASRSKIVRERYGEHAVYFCYVRVDDEIARLEMPGWVAHNPHLLDLAHGLVLDQCRRGQGYPVALSEAHEQAVVTAADRDNFWALVESLLAGYKLPGASSAKSRSKQTRWV